MKKKETTKYFYFAIAIGVIILFLLILASSVLAVGERLRLVSPYLEYGFYALALILIYFLIVRPVHIILFSPTFSVETTLDGQSRKNYRVYKRVAKRLIEQGAMSEEAQERLKLAMKDYAQLRVELHATFNKHIKKIMNDIIRKNAKTVMISTAISQNGRLDSLLVVVVNLRMIKDLVVACGFRPSIKHLAKLTINVFLTAMIAEGLENMNITELMPTSTVNTLGEIPLVKPMISSVVQGISNALLTLRIGVVTRKYLFSDAKEISKEDIRRNALLEAAAMTPSVIADALAMFPKKFFGLFKKSGSKDQNNETSTAEAY
jgi:hypothetical protein